MIHNIQVLFFLLATTLIISNNDQLCSMKWYKNNCSPFISVTVLILILTNTLSERKERRMFVSVCNKDKERRIGYCLQPLQLLQVEVTGGLAENNDGDMRFGGI